MMQYENLIFLFLDVNDSTIISLRLGHERYASVMTELWKEVHHLTQIYNGTLYQIVGDEMVIYWAAGSENFRNSLSLFEKCGEVLSRLKEEYDISVALKGAIHVGEVTKSLILNGVEVYFGSVLNISARILEFAKGHRSKLVVSEPAMSFCPSLAKQGPFRIGLRGLDMKLNVYIV